MTYIVTGYYGSGKTEFVLNLAVALAGAGGRLAVTPAMQSLHLGDDLQKSGIGERITIADLDVINPFFRSRECANALAPLGIQIMGSVFENHVAQDVPALSFALIQFPFQNQKAL